MGAFFWGVSQLVLNICGGGSIGGASVRGKASNCLLKVGGSSPFPRTLCNNM